MKSEPGSTPAASTILMPLYGGGFFLPKIRKVRYGFPLMAAHPRHEPPAKQVNSHSPG
jgi:hypothetical protein